jgi:hypothetical protein
MPLHIALTRWWKLLREPLNSYWTGFMFGFLAKAHDWKLRGQACDRASANANSGCLELVIVYVIVITLNQTCRTQTPDWAKRASIIHHDLGFVVLAKTPPWSWLWEQVSGSQWGSSESSRILIAFMTAIMLVIVSLALSRLTLFLEGDRTLISVLNLLIDGTSLQILSLWLALWLDNLTKQLVIKDLYRPNW